MVECSLAATPLLDFVTDGDTVRVFSKTHERQESHQFELAKICASRHLFNYAEERILRLVSRSARRLGHW